MKIQILFLAAAIGAVLLASASIAQTPPPQAVLAVENQPVTAGEQAALRVLIPLDGAEAPVFQPPASLPCRLTCNGASHETTAVKITAHGAAGLDLAPGFARFDYVLTLPDGVQGPVLLETEALNAPALWVAASPRPQSPPERPSPGDDATMEALFNEYQPYAANLGVYKPMYFLVGADPENSKFQLSFRYRFFKTDNTFMKKHPWLTGLHFAYTQTSFWDLESESAPFKDTSYKPEFFFAHAFTRNRPKWLEGLFLQTGFQHESNGRGESESRSTNFLYATPGVFTYHKKTGLGFMAALTGWAYVNNEDETNPDLASYRGYFDLDLKIGQAQGLVLGSNLRWAHEGGSVQVDLTYPLHRHIWRHLNLCLHAQYVNALAESLLNYQERTEAVRLGLSLIR